MAAPSPPAVGPLLRGWRRRRNLSEMEVALTAAVSGRHLSFVETGRSRPSREMVLHLAERLDVRLGERNALGVLLEGVSSELLQPPANALRIAFTPTGWRRGS